MVPSSPRLALFLGGLAAAVALAVAFAAEWWGGLVPCPLCLIERWPYRVAIAVAAVGVVLPRALTRPALAALLLVGLVEVAAAGLHVGVELHFWPSPLPECAAPTLSTGNLSQMLSSMPLRPSKPCDSPTFLIPGLPLSMAAMNLIYALVVAAVLVTYLSRRSRRRR